MWRLGTWGTTPASRAERFTFFPLISANNILKGLDYWARAGPDRQRINWSHVD